MSYLRCSISGDDSTTVSSMNPPTFFSIMVPTDEISLDDSTYQSNVNNGSNYNSNEIGTITIPRDVYEMMMQREQMYEIALKKKEEMRYELEASALDMERATLQCRIEMDALQVASQSKPCQMSLGTAAESFYNTSLNETNLEGLRLKMRSLIAQRDRIMPNHQPTELMRTHRRKLTQLDSAIQAMPAVMSESRVKLEGAIDQRNGTIQEQSGMIADLRKSLEAAHMKIAEWAETHRKWLIDESHLRETTSQLRGKLALVEAQAAESLHVTIAQLDRERDIVARLEKTVSHLRDEAKSAAVGLEREKLQARDDAQERSDLQTLVDELEREKAAWKQALAASKTENDALTSNLEKTKFDLAYQVQTLTTQIDDGKPANDQLRKRCDGAQDEIRGLKDDLRKALETLERDKHNATASKAGAGGELAELRERTAYLRKQADTAELKIKTQRDEMDDLTRAHRNHVSDLDDTLRRVKAHLATAHEQLVNVPLLQSKVDQFKEQVLQLTHESKVLAIEVGSLQAENARLTLANSQESRTEANPVAINIPAEIAAARAEALQYKLENDRLRLEVEYKCREMDAQAANMKTLESRKDFLSKSLTELEDHMVRLSGQVKRERSMGNSTEQRIVEMRRLVPHWRWEALERSDRTIGTGSPPRLDMLSYSFSSTPLNNSFQR